MGDINRALGAAGAGAKIVGTDYTLSPLTKGAQSEIEAWAESRARAAVHAMRAEVDEDTYLSALAKVAERSASGVYSFGGKLCDRMLRSPAGIVFLLLISLRPKHPKVTEADVMNLLTDHGEETVAALNSFTEGARGNAQKGTDPPAAA